jgi:hypothetical protein
MTKNSVPKISSSQNSCDQKMIRELRDLRHFSSG